MPIIGDLNATNGSDIGKVEITDNTGADVLALDVQVGGASKFHVRTKDASIGSKPLVKAQCLVVATNPDADTAILVSSNTGQIAFGTINQQVLTKDMVAMLAGIRILGSGVTLVPAASEVDTAQFDVAAGEACKIFASVLASSDNNADIEVNASRTVNDTFAICAFDDSGTPKKVLGRLGNNHGTESRTMTWVLVAWKAP